MDQERDVPQFVMEYATAEQMAIDPANPSVHPVFECMAILMSNSLEPARTSLVVTGDFVASVKARLEPGDYRDGYHTDRNSGVVTGKTMTMPDGTIDVVLPSILFEPDDNPEIALFRNFVARRAVLHEAQHVAMEQSGEARKPGSFIGRRIGWANLRSSANQVIDEYRAEAAVFAQWPGLQLEWNAHEVLSTWVDRVTQSAFVDYQRDLDLLTCWRRVASALIHRTGLLGCAWRETSVPS